MDLSFVDAGRIGGYLESKSCKSFLIRLRLQRCKHLVRRVFSETQLFFAVFDCGLEGGCDCGVGGVREGSGDVVLVSADAFVYNRAFWLTCKQKRNFG